MIILTLKPRLQGTLTLRPIQLDCTPQPNLLVPIDGLPVLLGAFPTTEQITAEVTRALRRTIGIPQPNKMQNGMQAKRQVKEGYYLTGVDADVHGNQRYRQQQKNNKHRGGDARNPLPSL